MPQNSARQYFFYMILGSVLKGLCKRVSRSLTERTRCEKKLHTNRRNIKQWCGYVVAWIRKAWADQVFVR